jgi:plastocyanin
MYIRLLTTTLEVSSMQDHSASSHRRMNKRDSRWRASTFFIVFGCAFIVGLFALFWQKPVSEVAASVFGRKLDEPITRIYQFDYDYEPRHITWRVGDRVTIQLRNRSDTHWHEMVIGRGFDNTPSTFGPIATQFKEDFWDGVHVTFSHANHVDNLVVNKAIPTYIGPKPNIETGGDFSPTIQPKGGIDITFTVPNKPGKWYYGCFVQQYIHYLDGMRGTITILPQKQV